MFKIEPYEFTKLKQITDEKTGKRVYEINGEKYPSVTTVLQELSKKTITAWRKRVGEQEANKISNKATKRGKAVDKICEDYVLNKDISYIKSDPFSVFHQLKPILDKELNLVHNVQVPLYSHQMRVAGTADLFCRWADKLTILDFKTSKKEKKEEWIKNYLWQCTLYAMCVYELKRIKVPQIVILIGVDHAEPQLFVRKTSDYVGEVYKFIKDWHLKYD